MASPKNRVPGLRVITGGRGGPPRRRLLPRPPIQMPRRVRRILRTEPNWDRPLCGKFEGRSEGLYILEVLRDEVPEEQDAEQGVGREHLTRAIKHWSFYFLGIEVTIWEKAFERVDGGFIPVFFGRAKSRSWEFTYVLGAHDGSPDLLYKKKALMRMMRAAVRDVLRQFGR